MQKDLNLKEIINKIVKTDNKIIKDILTKKFNLNGQQKITIKFQQLYHHNIFQDYLKFTKSGIRTSNMNNQMNLIVYRVCWLLSLHFLQISIKKSKQFKLMIMITASHNHKSNNGVKIDLINKDKSYIQNKKLEQQIELSINNFQSKFFQLIMKKKVQVFLKTYKKIVIQNPLVIYIARDSRPSSIIIKNIIQTFGKQFFDLFKFKIHICDFGELSTPTAFLIGEQLAQNRQIQLKLIKKQIDEQQITKRFYQNIFFSYHNSFKRLFDVIYQKQKIRTNRKIFIDFSNGIGSIQFNRFIFPFFKKLLNECNISFDIQLQTPIFSQVNEKCGADYIYKSKNKSQLKQKIQTIVKNYNQYDNQYDRIYHFDGDADRIIISLPQKNLTLNGDYINAFYSLSLVDLLEKIKSYLKQKIHKSYLNEQLIVILQCLLQKINKIEIFSISNIYFNNGLKEFYESNLNKIQFQISSVGINNLFSLVNKILDKSKEKLIIFSVFQPNGHGNLFFSQKTLTLLNQIQHIHTSQNIVFSDELPIQFYILKTLYLTSSNSKKGYALGNFLTFQLLQNYYNQCQLSSIFSKEIRQKINRKEYFLFQSKFQLETKISLGSKLLQKQFSRQSFKNNQSEPHQLVQPLQLVKFIKDLIQNQQNSINLNLKNVSFFLRASQTQPILRLLLKGQQQKCISLQKIIQENFEKTYYESNLCSQS